MAKYIDLTKEREVEVSDTEIIKIEASAQEGREEFPFVSMRLWVNTKKYSGPTKKGFTFDPEWLHEMIEKLQAVEDDLMEKGIL